MNANTSSASPSAPPGSETDPTDWEARYQMGDTPWEKGEAAPPLIDFLSRHAIRGKVLIPGCGTGHDVRALAAHAPEEIFPVGLDLSETAITLARSIPPAGRETYEQGNLFTLPDSWSQRFDWVVEHTCFCAIPPSLRTEYCRAISATLKPGGRFFAIFYLNPGSEEGPPFGVSKEEISQLFDADFELLESWVPEQTFVGREGRELCQLRSKKS